MSRSLTYHRFIVFREGKTLQYSEKAEIPYFINYAKRRVTIALYIVENFLVLGFPSPHFITAVTYRTFPLLPFSYRASPIHTSVYVIKQCCKPIFNIFPIAYIFTMLQLLKLVTHN